MKYKLGLSRISRKRDDDDKNLGKVKMKCQLRLLKNMMMQKKSEKSESEMPIEVVRELVNMNKLPPSLQLLPNI